MMILPLGDRLMDYEMGYCSDREVLQLFSELVKSGDAWSLQGHYGRTATALIEEGYLSPHGDILIPF